GADPEPWEDLADRTAEAIDGELWDDEQAAYLDHDVVAGEAVSLRSGAAFAPLHAGVPSPERAETMVAGLPDAGVGVAGGFAGTSLPPGDPRFDPTLYWRGPIWPIHNWV